MMVQKMFLDQNADAISTLNETTDNIWKALSTLNLTIGQSY